MIDAHCHAWRRWPYDRAVSDPDSYGSAESLLFEMDQADVQGAAIACARIGGGAGGSGFANEDNNKYVVQFATSHPDRITAWVDIDCSWRPEYHTPGAAERLMREITDPCVTGFTHYCMKDNDGWMLTDDADELFGVAAENSLVASLSVGASWVDDLSKLAARHPSLPILIHHLGVPNTWNEANAILTLSESDNIGIKISGFGYSHLWPSIFPYGGSKKWLLKLFQSFGPTRLFWGSDWPASKNKLTYTQSIEMVERHLEFSSHEDLEAILGGNLQYLLTYRSMPLVTSS